jgi:hypothetical protein
MHEGFALTPIPNTKHAVAIHEEACEIRLGRSKTRTECRVAFDVTQFPSSFIEIPELSTVTDDQEPISIQFLDLDFELSDGILSGLLWRQPQNYKYHYHLRYGDPIAVAKPGKVTQVDALVYNMSPFSFRGAPTRGLDPLDLEFDGVHFSVRPISEEYVEILPRITTPWQKPTNTLTITIDDDGMDSSDIETSLFDIRQFLSFAWGRYIGVALARGLGKKGDLLFRHWGMIRADPLVPTFQQTHWFLPAYSDSFAIFCRAI